MYLEGGKVLWKWLGKDCYIKALAMIMHIKWDGMPPEAHLN